MAATETAANLNAPSALAEMIAIREFELANLRDQRAGDIVRLYQDGYAMQQIADYHRITKARVQQMLVDAGVPRRPRGRVGDN